MDDDRESKDGNRGRQIYTGKTFANGEIMIGKETPEIKYDRALTLFQESVLEPNPQLRVCAHNQGCFDELMEIREHVLEYLKTLRAVSYTHLTLPTKRIV